MLISTFTYTLIKWKVVFIIFKGTEQAWITFTHLANAFIQSDLQPVHYTLYIILYIFHQYVCSLGIEPTTFALIIQCSTTEPQEHNELTMNSQQTLRVIIYLSICNIYISICMSSYQGLMGSYCKMFYLIQQNARNSCHNFYCKKYILVHKQEKIIACTKMAKLVYTLNIKSVIPSFLFQNNFYEYNSWNV